MDRIKERFVETLEGSVPLHGMSVLEVGCGDGARSVRIARRCRCLTGIDPDREKIHAATRRIIPKENASFEVQRAESLPYPSQWFDTVIFTLSLHHVPVVLMRQAISVAVATCKQEGFIVFLEPAMEGSFYEAEVDFGACDGDERAEKLAAQQAIGEHPDLERVVELADETVFRFRSYSDFVASMAPHKGHARIPAFLAAHGNVLRAPRIITVCKPRY